MNWKRKDIRYLPVGLKQSETSHGSTNFNFAKSGKELQSTFLSPTRSDYSSGWELEFLTKNCNFPCGNWNWYCILINLRVCRRHDTQLVFSFSYWSDGKCQEKLKTMLRQNLEPISIQAKKVNRKWKKKKKKKKKEKKCKPAVEVQWTSLSLRHVGASYVLGIHCCIVAIWRIDHVQ